MSPLRVKVFVESHAAHTTQFYSGLYMLQDQGLATVSLQARSYHNHGNIRLQVNDVPVFIDLSDHSNIDKTVYDQCSFYFKRMLLKSDAQQYSKLHPYGLNYPVYYKHDRTFRRSLFSKNWKYILNTFARSSSLLTSLFNINLAHKTARVQNFEQLPINTDEAKVIFSARLWLPEKPRAIEKQQQRKFINEQRIAIVNKARQRLGDHFIGGIDKDEYASSVAEDALIQDSSFSYKAKYLQALRNCSIGIATAGLEDSIGFKFAEYVCMSKAIVTSPIDQYLLPGEFADGENYLSFDNTAEDCIDKCEQLMRDRALRNKLMQNNHSYYNNYLRPDKLVWNILKTVADA
jgi:hypothetical protein